MIKKIVFIDIDTHCVIKLCFNEFSPLAIQSFENRLYIEK